MLSYLQHPLCAEAAVQLPWYAVRWCPLCRSERVRVWLVPSAAADAVTRLHSTSSSSLLARAPSSTAVVLPSDPVQIDVVSAGGPAWLLWVCLQVLLLAVCGRVVMDSACCCCCCCCCCCVQDLSIDFDNDLAFPLYSYIGAGAFGQVGLTIVPGLVEHYCWNRVMGPPAWSGHTGGPPARFHCTQPDLGPTQRHTPKSRTSQHGMLHPCSPPSWPQVHRALLRGALPVAVKLLANSGVPVTPSMVASLVEEMHIMSRVSHPNIVK
jgi:hypothetical protein